MDARLVLSALKLLKRDLDTGQIAKRFRALTNSANAAAGSPTDANAQAAFSTSSDEFLSACNSASANLAPLSLRKAIENLSLERLVGEQLADEVEVILSRTPFLLSQASHDLGKLANEIEAEANAKITAGVAALEHLGIKPLQIDSTLAEIGVLLPTSLVDDDLALINRNLKQWEKVIRDFVELTSGKPPSKITLAAVSSGSFDIFVSIDIEGAAALAMVVSTIIGGFHALTRAREQRATMESLRYPQKVIDGAKEHEDTLLATIIEEATQVSVKQMSKELDSSRKAEVSVAIKKDVEFIARSINQGVDIEVTPPQLDASADASTVAAQDRLKKASEEINKLTRALPDRSTPLAALPAPSDDEEVEEVAPKKTKRKRAEPA